MSISAGSFTVGSGGDYASWDAAFNDLDPAGLSGDLTLTQITDTTLTADAEIVSIYPLNGYTLHVTSTLGLKTTISNNAEMDPRPGNGADGVLIVENLFFVDTSIVDSGTSCLFAVSNLDAGNPANKTVVRNNRFKGVSGGVGRGMSVESVTSSKLHVYNNLAWDFDLAGIEVFAGNANQVVENNTAFRCPGIGFKLVLTAPNFGTVHNNLAIQNGTDYSLPNTFGTVCAFSYNTSQDSTSTGNVNFTVSNSGTGATSAIFGSTVDTNPDFLRVLTVYTSAVDGSAPVIASNTTGWLGQARPGVDGFYSRGADESTLNPPAPVITSVGAPTSGFTTGGTLVPVAGTNFWGPLTVTVDGIAASYSQAVPGSDIVVTTPAHSATGAVDVVVTSSYGSSTAAASFTYVNPPPDLTSISPVLGPIIGGTLVTLTGTAFLPGATVKFGGVDATFVVFVNSTTITCVTPAHSLGSVSVLLTNPDAQTDTLAAAYEYRPSTVMTGEVDATAVLTVAFPAVVALGTVRGSAQVTGGFVITRAFFASGDNLITSPALVTQGGFRYLPSISGTAGGVAAFTFHVSFSVGNPAIRTITIPAQLTGTGGGLRFHTSMPGVIEAPAILSYLAAGFVVERSAAENRDAAYETTGYRGSFPFIVYKMGAMTDVDIALVPPNRSFLVSPQFISSPGDPFSDSGAGANFIGTRVVPNNGSSYLAFRKPDEWEVVYFIAHGRNESCLYRYELNRDTALFQWKQYRSIPQRFLDGMYAFNVFDPDKIYEYYSGILGATYSQWSYDTFKLAAQFDAETCSQYYLPSLAYNFGMILKEGDSLSVNRHKVKNAIPSAKLKGTEKSIELRLLSLGYHGYAREVWINPGAAAWKLTMNYTGSAGNIPIVYEPAGCPHITVTGFKNGGDAAAAYGLIQFRRGRTPSSPFIGETAPEDFERITISDGTLTKTFEFRRVAFLSDPATASDPSFVCVKFLRYEDITDTAIRFITAVGAAGFNFTIASAYHTNVFGPPINDLSVSSSDTGALDSSIAAAASDYLEVPHGYSPVNPELYWPSSHVAIHLNDRLGSPIDITDAVKQAVWAELHRDVLPIHINIRYFATDVDVNNGAEAISIGETFSVTEVP